MGEEPSPDPLLVQRILERLFADRSQGIERSLDDYRAAFPGHEETVAAQYRAVFALTEPRSASSVDDSGRFDLPERFGRFRVVGLLGRGGQGIVYHCVDEALHRDVALKVLTEEMGLSVEALARFATEARLASKLDHPHICRIHDVFEHRGRPALAMQYVEGRSLDRHIRELRAAWPGFDAAARQAAVRELVETFEKLARAMHFAHRANVLHRDLKPANILLDASGEPVILDFGIARSLEDDDLALTRTGATPGTPAYAAPEQFASGRQRPDARTDVWALGVSLYEALALGEQPFVAQSVRDLERSILGAPHRPIQSVAPWVGRELALVLDTALRKDLGGRYASAELLADDLRRVLEQRPVEARPISTWTRTLLWTSRHRTLAASLAVVTLTLLAATLVSAWYAVAAERSLASRLRVDDRRAASELATTARRLLDDTPAVPARVAVFEEWLAAARELTDRLPAYRAELARLRQEAVPDETEAEEVDAARLEHGPRAELAELRNVRRDAPALAARTDADAAPYLERAQELLRMARRTPADEIELQNRNGRWQVMRRSAEIAREALAAANEDREQELLAAVAAQRRLLHPDPLLDQRLHELERAVEALAVLESGDAGELFDAVAARRDFAVDLGARLEGADAGLWERCRTEVAAEDGVYRGLDLLPIPGLVPLGVDLDSGLWEFWVVASGPCPQWEGEPGGPGEVVLEADEPFGLVMVLVPGATFTMGTSFELQPREAGAYEVPTAEVELAPFLLSKFEVTQAQWEHAGLENVSERRAGLDPGVDGQPVSPRVPVDRVTWAEARSYCRRLDLEISTEAQWEYACRAGSTTGFPYHGDKHALEGFANVSDATAGNAFDVTPVAGSRMFDYRAPWEDGFGFLAPVGSFSANAFGLYDTWGNASEWVLDRFFALDERSPRPGDGLRGALVANRSRTLRTSGVIIPWALASAFARRSANEGDRPTFHSLRPARSLDPRPMH